MTELPRDSQLETPVAPTRPYEASGLKTVTVFVIVLLFHMGGIATFFVWQHYHSVNPDSSIANVTGEHPQPGDNLTPNQGNTDALPSNNNTAPAPADATTTTTNNQNDPAPATATGDNANVANTTAPAQSVVVPNSYNATTMTQAAPLAVTQPAPAPAVQPDSAPAVAAPETPAAPAVAGSSYIVKKGDSLAKIAHHFHLKLSALKSANTLASDSVKVGQQLVIPMKVTAPQTSTVTPMLTAATPAPTPAPMTDPAAPIAPTTPAAPTSPTEAAPAPTTPAPSTTDATAGGTSYTVKKGDTMTRIAHHFHIKLVALETANPSIDPAKLSIGMKLTIPAKPASSSTTSTTHHHSPSPSPTAKPTPSTP